MDITGGYWNIGPDPTNNKRGVSTKYKYKYTDLLPHQISEWEYLDDGEMYADPKLTVTGNIISLRSLY